MVNGTREIVKHRYMRFLFFFVVVVCLWSAVAPADAQVNVTQFHNHDSRDGLYVDAAFTPSAVAKLTRDLNFDGTIAGNVYAQPLYIEGGPGGRAMIIAVTESNNVYALDAVDGTIIWQRNVGEPVSADDLICTKFDPMGITGTPIVDLASRALFLDANDHARTAARPRNTSSFPSTWTQATSTPAGPWTLRRQLHTTAYTLIHRFKCNDRHSVSWVRFFMSAMGV